MVLATSSGNGAMKAGLAQCSAPRLRKAAASVWRNLDAIEQGDHGDHGSQNVNEIAPFNTKAPSKDEAESALA